jgi:PPOX class probable F420-dependent enzyme
VDTSEALERLSNAQVGYLATAGADGRPHVVPFVFAIEEGRIVSAVDHKPKRSPDLRRLRNIAANPAVSVLVDHYDDDWNRLWWVRADGRGRVVSDGSEFRAAIAALVAKYQQYEEIPPNGPAIVVDVEHVTGWGADRG